MIKFLFRRILLTLPTFAALMFVTVDAVMPLYATRWWLMW